MEYTTNDVVNATTELARANNYPLIRVTSGPLQGKLHLNAIPPGPARERLAVDLPWSVANASTIGGVGGGGGWDFFSALCWFSLRDTMDANAAAGVVDLPLGGVVECYGGTSIQYWSSADAIAACPLAATNPGTACCGYGGNNSCLFDAQVAPYTVGPTRFAAVLWMQGASRRNARSAVACAPPAAPLTHNNSEPGTPPRHHRAGEQNANCGGPAQIAYYSCALPALIADWRAKFGSPSLPFGVFLLAAWKATDPAFPLLRLLQVGAAAAIPNVFTASTLDAGEPNGGPVHSPFKQLPASRAARALQALLYGRAVGAWRGPRAASARADSLTAPVEFGADAAGAPLALDWSGATCPPAVGAASCESFAVLTSDCAWRSVESAGGGGAALAASLPSPTALALTLQGGGVAGLAIVAVRGYFANWPLVALRNAAGLPAEPWLLNVSAHNCSSWPRAEAWVDSGVHA